MGKHTIYNAFNGYKFINNSDNQLLIEDNTKIPETFNEGMLVREEITYENIILAININTYETENVTESVFNEGNHVKVGTKPVWIKIGKDVIFKGYAKKFIKDNIFEIKETWINRVLKNKRTGSWADLSPTYTKKAKDINPQIFVKRVTKID